MHPFVQSPRQLRTRYNNKENNHRIPARTNLSLEDIIKRQKEVDSRALNDLTKGELKKYMNNCNTPSR